MVNLSVEDRPARLPLAAVGRRVLVIDADPIIRAGWSAVLGAQPWVDRCIGAADLASAAEQMRLHSPDVALVGLFLDDEHGIEVCRRLRELDPELPVMLVTEGRGLPLGSARAAGAAGIMHRGTGVEVLVEAVWRVAEGHHSFPDAASRAVGSSRLSRRERTVLSLLAAGASNVEIASALHLSPHTIKEYTQAVFRKLGVRNRVEAATAAARLGYAD